MSIPTSKHDIPHIHSSFHIHAAFTLYILSDIFVILHLTIWNTAIIDMTTIKLPRIISFPSLPFLPPKHMWEERIISLVYD